MRLIALLITLTLCSIANAEDYYIDDYEFTWTVLKEGKSKLEVIKNDETSYVSLYKDAGLSSFLRLTGKEAKDISEALKKTRDYFKKQKGTAEDISESVVAGEYNVTFRTSVKYGFSVTIRKNSRYSMGSFSLEKSEAIKFQPQLAKAPELIEFLNKKISF